MLVCGSVRIIIPLRIVTQVVEPLVSKQWFVTMKPLADKALQAVEDGELRIIPDRFEKVRSYFVKFFFCVCGFLVTMRRSFNATK